MDIYGKTITLLIQVLGRLKRFRLFRVCISDLKSGKIVNVCHFEKKIGPFKIQVEVKVGLSEGHGYILIYKLNLYSFFKKDLANRA